MKSPSILFALILCGFTTFGQADPDTLGNIYDDLFKKNRGTIGLHSGKKIEGYLDYNMYTASLKLTSDKGIELLYTPGEVTSFEYTDEATGQRRSFITCNVTFSDENENGPQFLEVLLRGNDILYLNLVMPMLVERKTADPGKAVARGNPASSRSYPMSGDKLVTQQVDILYFMKNDSLYPYIVYRDKVVSDLAGSSLTSGRRRYSVDVVDKGLPQFLMGAKYDVVKKYASKQRLDWTDRNDLVKIMQHYAGLK